MFIPTKPETPKTEVIMQRPPSINESLNYFNMDRLKKEREDYIHKGNDPTNKDLNPVKSAFYQ